MEEEKHGGQQQEGDTLKETYMQQALDQVTKEGSLIVQAQLGLERGEVPVGCIFVSNEDGRVLARSHNLTNATKNVLLNCVMLQATTHCEINCIREICKNGEKKLL